MAGVVSAGIRKLRYVQFGKEATLGTSVAATALWRGSGLLEDKRRVQFPVEDIGIMGGVDRSYVDQYAAALTLDPVPADFEQLPYLFESGVKTVGTGVADGTGSGKVYAYPLPTTSPATVSSFTVEGGDNQQGERFTGGICDTIKLDGKAGEALMMSGTFFGQNVANQAKTGGLLIPTIEDVLFSTGSLYIDAVSGTAGTTQVATTLLAATATITTGWTPIWTADQLYYTALGFDGAKMGVTVNFTFLFDGAAVTERENWRNQTPRLLQLKWLGTSLTTAGTYSKKTLIATLPGKWAKFDKIGDQNGTDIITATYNSFYDPTYANAASFLVVNQVATLP